jgi:hypothetical protein
MNIAFKKYGKSHSMQFHEQEEVRMTPDLYASGGKRMEWPPLPGKESELPIKEEK